MIFIALHGRVGGQGRVAVELPLARTGPANAPAQTDRVVIAALERGLEVQARINGEADQVAVAAIAGGTHEQAHRPGRCDGRPPEHLVNDAIHHPVAPVPARYAGGVIRAAERLAQVVVAVVGELRGIVVAAQLVHARQAGVLGRVRHIGGLGVERVLQFGHQQRAGAHVEVRAVGAVIGLAGGVGVAAQRRAGGLLDGQGVVAVARRVIVGCGKHEGELLAWPVADADGGGRQRPRWPAAIQVDRRRHGPAEIRVEVKRGVIADQELGIEILLADLDVELAAKEGLLVPQLEQAGGAVGLEPADGVEIGQVILRDRAPACLQRADIEQAALQPEQLFGIHGKRGHGHAIIGRSRARAACAVIARRRAAGAIAPHFIDFLDIEADAVLVQPRPGTPHIAQQVAAGIEFVTIA
ncbi:hypothetical protein KOXY103107_17335 [Komagataeibacter xylinus]